MPKGASTAQVSLQKLLYTDSGDEELRQLGKVFDDFVEYRDV